MISFTHTADIHFGMENYGKVDPQTGIHSRLLDFEKALNHCIDVSIERKVDFFLFSGDAYKTAHPSPTQQKLLVRCLMRLYTAKIPVIIIVGNHDHPVSFGKAHSLDIFGSLPLDGFYVVAKPRTISLETKHGPINIVGIPWPTRSQSALSNQNATQAASHITQHIATGVAHIIARFAQELDPTIPAVLAGHLTVSSGIFSGSEKRAIFGNDPIFLPSQLAIPPFDYVALGHLHRYQNLNPQGYPAIVYAGSIERIDFGERKEDKGFCIVTIESKGNAHHEFIKGPMRPFIQIEVAIALGSDQTEQILAALKDHAIQDAVVKIIYRLAPGAKDMVDLKRVQRACASACYVVGVIPIFPVITRERRIGIKTESNYHELLDQYFITRPELKEHPQRRAALLEKALELLDQAQEPMEDIL